MLHYTKKLVLEDGREFPGLGFAADTERVGELVFNTSMVGYQEILSDPSYADQIIVMTYPLIGNYGITDEDYETKFPSIGGMIVKENNDSPSNFRYTKTLAEVLEENDIPAISGIDTRMLTRILRDARGIRAIITDIATPVEEAVAKIKAVPRPTDLVSRVSCKKRWFARTANYKYDIVAIDCGMKYNMVRSLNAHNCNVTVVPWNTTAEQIMAFNPDGVLISNGPGSPEDVPEVVETIRQLRGRVPMFGICLGHQLIALAYGAKIGIINPGHRGGNHPVKELTTGKVLITSQNHGYAVVPESVKDTPLEITHVNLLDNTVEGCQCLEDKVISVQFHPESAPGPQDSIYLFDKFIDIIPPVAK
ncbi:MAG: glutamine-hydrolyzing carbamoyl-phosphate synthase small subunit [Muribaculaceae bacterium]|nr:glutamine-hydrolyzing carbamoyl-phosphate synthase small subunit [Muribaculaceae bacterium]